MLNYKLSNICGCFYTGGKINFSEDGTCLFVPINNRIGIYDLNSNTYNTVNSESKNDIRFIAVHPNKEIAIVVDKFGYGTIINLLRDQIILRILFKSKTGVITANNYNNILTPQEEQDSINAATFTNKGKYFVLGIGRRIVIWESPTRKNNFRMLKYNDICYHSLNISSIDISEDDKYVLTSSFDLSIRIQTLKKKKKIIPTVLAGNKSTIIGAYFLKNQKGVFSVNKSGVIIVWHFYQQKTDFIAKIGEESRDQEEEEEEEEENEEEGEEEKEEEGEEEKEEEEEKKKKEEEEEEEEEEEKEKEKEEEGEEENQRTCEKSEKSKSIVSRKRRKKAFETGRWNKNVYFCNQEKNEDVTRICFNREKDLLAIAYTNGRFGIYMTPDMTALYNIRMNTNTIDDIAINKEGHYIALAEGNNGTVIVWEWKCESYVLKQNTSNKHIRCVKFSPIISHLKIGSKIVNTSSMYHEADNFVSKFIIATGNEDGTIKLYDYLSFINFATFSVHTSAVTDICFLPQGNAFISASLDGTLRAFDLLRYRNFKVYVPDFIAEESISKSDRNNKREKDTLRENVQFLCVDVNISGNIVAAGGRGREFIVYVWNVQTAKCVDKLFGHSEPIAKVCFSTNFKSEGVLATCSWNKNVLIWDLYSKNKSSKFEELNNSNDISYIRFDPRGNDILAVCTLGCKIIFWDLSTEEIVGTIEGDRDIKRGRLIKDRFQAIPKTENKRKKRKKRETIDENGMVILKEEEDIYVDDSDKEIHTIVNKNCYFTSIDYIHNGNYIVSCANCSVSLYIYDTTLYLLVKMIDLTKNFSVDGVQRELFARYLTDSGKHFYELNLSDDEGDIYLDNYKIVNRKNEQMLLPGQIDANYTNNKFKKFKMILNHLNISGDDRHIAVATNVGLYVFTKDYFYQFINGVVDKLNTFNSNKKKNPALGIYKGLMTSHTYTPKYLSEHVNTRNIKVCLKKKEYVKAFILSVALNDYSNILEVYEKTPLAFIPLCIKALSKPFIFSLLNFVKQLLSGDTLKHIHLHLYYLNCIFTIHFSLFQNIDFSNTFKTSNKKKQEDQTKDSSENIYVSTVDTSNESKTSLLMILKHLLIAYNSLNFLYSSNINVLLYLCMKDSSN